LKTTTLFYCEKTLYPNTTPALYVVVNFEVVGLAPDFNWFRKWSAQKSGSFTISVTARVARWFGFKPKIQIWVNLQWKMLVYFMDTWSILQSFVIFYGHLV
jgi:hypothetical protein